MSRREPLIKSLLGHPLTRGLDIDDPEVTGLRRRIIRQNVFLHRLYREWYRQIASALPPTMSEPAVELGSGAGFIKEVAPAVLTSDLNPGSSADLLLDGRCMPFVDESLSGVVLINVLHHISEPGRLFAEAARCVRPEGKLLLIEPWVTGWSRFIYTRLHHEPFLPDAETWRFQTSGPLSGANGALPWIIFERDRQEFERQFPEWRIGSIKLMMPFRYLVSGGVSMRPLMPGWSFGLWRKLESLLSPWMGSLAMFAFIELWRES